jgi:hypothetical protein
MKYHCVNGCTPTDMYGEELDTPFVYNPLICSLMMGLDESEAYELGVLVYPDLEISNRWEDGVVGVPEDLRRELEGYNDLPQCIDCGGPIEKTEE